MTDWVALIPHLVHDIRALVRQGLANAQLVERLAGSSLTPEAAARLQSTICAQQDLNRLVTRIGALAEAEKQSDAVSLVELDTAILTAKVHCQDPLDAASAEFSSVGIPACLVPSAVTKILIELLDNAVRYRHPERLLSIRIDAAQVGDRVEISVRDTGSSWDETYQVKLMQPLERLDSARGGFGLGLAIASALTEACGGLLRAEAGPGGSCFVLEVPATST